MPVTTIDTANIEATAIKVSTTRMQSFWVVVLCGVRMLVFMLRLYKARIFHRAVRLIFSYYKSAGIFLCFAFRLKPYDTSLSVVVP